MKSEYLKKEELYSHAATLVDYTPSTGAFQWKHNIGSRAMAGQSAGTIDQEGYRRISVGGNKIAAHRLAFFIVTGRMAEQIDHINGCREDNRIANLRSCSHAENGRNQAPRSGSMSGIAGVRWLRGKFHARIKVNKKEIHLGVFDEINQAIRARQVAELEHFGEFSPSACRGISFVEVTT